MISMSARLSKNRITAYSLLLLNAILWGFAVPIIKYSLNFTTPSVFLFYRFVIASFLFFPIFLLYKIKTGKKKINVAHHLILALLGTPLTLLPLFYGLSASSAIESSIIESASPIFVFLGGLVYLKEKATHKEWLGTIVALAGTLLLTVYPILTMTPDTLSVKGNILIIFSNLLWAGFLIKSKMDHTDPIYLSFFSFLISIPFFLGLNLLTVGNNFYLAPQAIPGVLYMAIGGSIIAFWAYQEGQKRIEASEAAVFSYLKPIFTIPLAYFWLKEPFGLSTILATALILLGVYLSEKK